MHMTKTETKSQRISDVIALGTTSLLKKYKKRIYRRQQSKIYLQSPFAKRARGIYLLSNVRKVYKSRISLIVFSVANIIASL